MPVAKVAYESRRMGLRSSVESSSPPHSPLTRKSRLSTDEPDQTYRLAGKKGLYPNLDWISENESTNDLSEDEQSHDENVEISQRTHISSSSPNSTSSNRNRSSLNRLTAELPSTDQPKTVPPNSSLSSLIYILAAILVCTLAVFFCIQKPENHNIRKATPPTTDKPIDQKEDVLTAKLLKEMKSMQRAFPNQSNDTWLNFVAAFLSIKEDDPPQPAVLLMVGPNSVEAVQTIQCVAKQLAKITNKLFEKSPDEMVIRMEDVLKLRDRENAVKEELDRRIQLVLNRSYSVVLSHLEQIPPGAVMLLHGYCDNFGAPFKQRVIILTATFHPDSHPVDSRQVDRQLRKLWDSRLGADKSASLVSRVANNPVFIQPESTTGCGPY